MNLFNGLTETIFYKLIKCIYKITARYFTIQKYLVFELGFKNINISIWKLQKGKISLKLLINVTVVLIIC